MTNKDDQIIALLTDIRNRLSSLDTRLKRVEDEVQRTHSDVVTTGHWTKEIRDRRSSEGLLQGMGVGVRG